jgi:hypothetical protein
VESETRDAMDRVEQGLRAEIQATHRRIEEAGAASERRDIELGERIDRLEHRLRAEIQASAAETRRHFDVAVEAFRDETRTLAEGIMAVIEASLRRDTEVAERSDRLDQRVLGLEARVSILEQGAPRRSPSSGAPGCRRPWRRRRS